MRNPSLYIRPKPWPPELIRLDAGFWADRIEIGTDEMAIPRGVWLRVTDGLVARLERKIEAEADPEARDRAERLLSLLKAESW